MDAVPWKPEESCDLELIHLPNRLARIVVEPLSMSKKAETAIEHIRQSIPQSGLDDEALEAALASYPKPSPKTIDPAARTGTTVSLCMIANNEEAHLARCLLSVDEVVDEIIVVDTGSSDCTREIAEAFGARVEAYAWTEDFAAARNVSLASASADWILILDADEALYNYGISQFYLGNPALSIEAFQTILKMEPNYLPAAFMLGASCCCNGMRARGVETLDRLRNTAIAPYLSARCLDLTRGLLMRRMLDPAILLLGAAIETRVLGDEATAILTSIRNLKINAT